VAFRPHLAMGLALKLIGFSPLQYARQNKKKPATLHEGAIAGFPGPENQAG
jgi:hypothetical protein